MHTRSVFPPLVSALAVALCLAAPATAEPSATLPGTLVAEGEKTAPQPAPSPDGTDPAGVLKPKTYQETPAEVAECEKSWDPQTGMSKEEYVRACKRTLKYFPENSGQ